MDWSTGNFFTETIVRLDNELNFGEKISVKIKRLRQNRDQIGANFGIFHKKVY